MQVLHIYTGNLYGGIERFLSTLGRNQAVCAAMKPHFALCFSGRLSSELEKVDVPLHDLGPVRARNLFAVLRARQRLSKIVTENRISLAICHGVWSQALFGPVIKKHGATSVFWQHDAITGKGWMEFVARRNPPDFIMTNSRFTQSTLKDLYPSIASKVVHYPIDNVDVQAMHSQREQVREELEAPGETCVIVQASRLEGYKGHENLLNALSLIRHIPNWVCWIVGGPQRPHEQVYLQALKDLSVRLGIADRVRFTGQRNDVARVLAGADIFCQPNAGPEPFGLSFIEALAMSLPVVTTNIGAAGEIVTKSCGLLAEAGNLQDLANQLESLIQNPDWRKELGAGGPQRAAELCDTSRQLRQVSDVLSSLLEEPVAASPSVVYE